MSASEKAELSLEPLELIENESGPFTWNVDDSFIDPLGYAGIEPASPAQLARMKDKARRPLEDPKDFTDEITKHFRDELRKQEQSPDAFSKRLETYLAKSDGQYEIRSNKEARRRERGVEQNLTKFVQGSQYIYGDGQSRKILYVLIFPTSLRILTD
ncbi:hypothetical protein [Granulicella mallensis]|uniref:Uncharacterized protein n=1 Tax=Granulicella mallensis TaxID=940614 RepID=A0A7W7ZU70_9BACT|nr:hypothetical protein [Granulicella mallensis]MBB5066175.1 hypothetical protein [Granulicella mallensis]